MTSFTTTESKEMRKAALSLMCPSQGSKKQRASEGIAGLHLHHSAVLSCAEALG